MQIDHREDLQNATREVIVQALRRWGLVIVLGTVAAAATAFVASKLTTPEYRATAQLFLTPASAPTVALSDVVLGQSLARSYVQLATAEVVLAAARDTVGYEDVSDFKTRVQVSQLRDTSVITISFRSPDPQLAARAANAVADSFIAQTRELQTSLQGSTANQLEDQIRSLQRDIADLDAQIRQLRSDLAQTPRPNQSPVVRTDLQTELLQLDGSRQTKQQTLAQLLKTRDDMRLAAARAENTVSLWQPAYAPTIPESPRPLLNTAIGALSGFLVTLVGIALLTYLDDRVTDPDQARARLGVAALGQVLLAENPASTAGKLFMRDRPTSSEAEAFRSLRTNLQFASVDKPPRSLLITSARAGEGKSVLSANLALAFAEAGTPTVLIDGDLRRPSQHRLFRLAANAGVTSLLTGSTSISSLAQFRVSPMLTVIPSGPLPPNPAEMLASAKMSSLIASLEGLTEGGIVLIDTSPILAVADPLALATKVDACVLVVDAVTTRTAAARRAVEALRAVHATLVGVVLNKISASSAPYYYGYYTYGPTGTAAAKVGHERRT